MTGWLMLALLVLIAAALLWRMRVARMLWPLAGAMLMLGAAGYALQGSPGLPGKPVAAGARDLSIDPSLVALRGEMLGRFGTEGAYLALSDAMLRLGDSRLAANSLVGGIRAMPRSVVLWTELGTVLAIHSRNQVAPAALLAFQRAIRLAPRHPGPPFFLGTAYVRAGEFAAAKPWWDRALRLTPPSASYRGEIARRVALLEQYLAAAPPS